MKYYNAQTLLELAKDNNMKISDVVLEAECALQEKSKEVILEDIKATLTVMKKASTKACDENVVSISGISGGDALKLTNYIKSGKSLCGDTIMNATTKAVSCSEVNASMGKIVAFPTAGSCGIVPGAIFTIAEKLSLDDDALINALLTASAIGSIIANKATLAGAEGGCQAECGSAVAMAAAAVVQMVCDDPQTALNAASLGLKNMLGLACDPVAGLVEIPCIKRNGVGASIALTAADMALAGVESKIPFDDVVDAMSRIGRAMPIEIKETAMGGLATTCKGKELANKLLEKTT